MKRTTQWNGKRFNCWSTRPDVLQMNKRYPITYGWMKQGVIK